MADDLHTRLKLIEEQARLRATTERERDHRRYDERQALTEAEVEGALKLRQFDTSVEQRDLDFYDRVREENLRLQALSAELAIRAQHGAAQAKQEHKNALEVVYAELLKMLLAKKLENKAKTHANELAKDMEAYKASLRQVVAEMTENEIADLMRQIEDREKRSSK